MKKNRNRCSLGGASLLSVSCKTINVPGAERLRHSMLRDDKNPREVVKEA
jgi:hypothetical protein